MHLRNHKNFFEMKRKKITLGGFCLGVFLSGVLEPFYSDQFSLSGLSVRHLNMHSLVGFHNVS